ncbi:uncharacterized protein SCHCODRAFT_02707277 [Schizophyllum commune H4-8]|nr:uncharacterized protein SCHCODRAFT_02707277 [Schizophyllum commune H4-8]KAI5884957.1 hypothetical protein SCHCODRAFT_02707277 [Schizophyllum commune H4-8]
MAAHARAEGINKHSGCDIWYNFKRQCDTERKKGRPRKLTPKAELHIMHKIHCDWREPDELVAKLVGVSASTVRRYLASKGYRRVKAKHAFYLTPIHKKQRLQWAQAHQRRSLTNVAWTDEYYVHTDRGCNAIFITRRPDEKYKEHCLIPTFKQLPVHIMVWGCIMKDRKGPLVILNYPGGREGGMTAARYIEQVLEGAWMLFYEKVRKETGWEVLSQQDGAPAYGAKITRVWIGPLTIHTEAGY